MRMLGAAVLTTLALALVACGADGGNTSGSLAWTGDPRVVTPQGLPEDRTLTGKLRNDSLKKVDLRSARDVKVLDEDGNSVPATAIFTDTFARSIYPPARGPSRDTRRSEENRIGLRASLQPGGTTPITVSWRAGPGASEPVRIEIAGSSLAIPRR